MRAIVCIFTFAAFVSAGVCLSQTHEQKFPWLATNESDAADSVASITLPEGYQRRRLDPDSFGAWLRRLPLKKVGSPVRLHDGTLKGNQSAQFRVLEIDVGDDDLQQCADAVMRLRAEYLFACKKLDRIHFNFTSGDVCSFSHWASGYRPKVRGNQVEWIKSSASDSAYSTFRKYLKTVFTYAGSYSLSRELDSVGNPKDIRAGDVFIRGGFPGHAVIVIDIAHNPEDGSTIFLLAQSYMPAQDIHILKNPTDPHLSPWYRVETAGKLYTPEWIFDWSELRRFGDD